MQKSCDIFAFLFCQFRDYLFPNECLFCSKEGAVVCASCVPKPSFHVRCVRCGFGSFLGVGRDVCENCLHELGLTSVSVACVFGEKHVSELVHALKYEYIEAVAQVMARVAHEKVFRMSGLSFLQPYSGGGEGTALVSIPLHRRRLCERGFNQSELFARHFSDLCGIAVSPDLLKRRYFTSTQTELKKQQRLQNVHDAFLCMKTPPSTVILIDDVFTTGATVAECARVLRARGAKQVHVIAFAAQTIEHL